MYKLKLLIHLSIWRWSVLVCEACPRGERTASEGEPRPPHGQEWERR